jgi:hypothetical protein
MRRTQIMAFIFACSGMCMVIWCERNWENDWAWFILSNFGFSAVFIGGALFAKPELLEPKSESKK